MGFFSVDQHKKLFQKAIKEIKQRYFECILELPDLAELLTHCSSVHELELGGTRKVNSTDSNLLTSNGEILHTVTLMIVENSPGARLLGEYTVRVICE